LKAEKVGKAPIDEGTSSKSSHSEIEKNNYQSTEPKNNVATSKNHSKAFKDKG